MADHNKPTATDNFADWPALLKGRSDDLAVMMDPAVVTVTNPPVGAGRWTSAGKKWEKWNGSGWVDLTDKYAISISGTADGNYKSGDAISASSLTVVATSSTALSSSYGGISYHYNQSSDATGYPNYGFKRSLGSVASPTDVTSGTILGRISGYGYFNAGWREASRVELAVDGTPSGSSVPGMLKLSTVNSAGVMTLALVLRADQSAQFYGPIGYATGNGGTVTQATSKSTAVTLNKVCGQITMHNAALAAGAAVAFTFNNSMLAATDTMTLNLLDTSIGSPLSYRVWASVKAGVAIVCVENRSGGSLSEAVAINFDIKKGVTS